MVKVSCRHALWGCPGAQAEQFCEAIPCQCQEPRKQADTDNPPVGTAAGHWVDSGGAAYHSSHLHRRHCLLDTSRLSPPLDNQGANHSAVKPMLC